MSADAELTKNIKRSISRCVKEAEEAGSVSFESQMFQTLRDQVKTSNYACTAVANVLRTFLSFNSCVTRLHTMHLIDYFYSRSKLFRKLIDAHLHDVLMLTAEIDILHSPLPQPKEDANKLKVFTIATFKKWNENYGKSSVPLQCALTKLKTAKSLDFNQVSAEMLAERRRREEQERKRNEKQRVITDRISGQLEEKQREILASLNSSRTLLRILVPSFIDDDQSSTSTAPSEPQAHGYTPGEAFSVRISVAVPKITVDESNEDVVEAAIDIHRVLKGLTNNVNQWLRDLRGITNSSLITRLISLKTELEVEVSKLNELGLVSKRRKKREEDSSSSEDDLIDVPDEEYGILDDGKGKNSQVEEDTQTPCCSKDTTKEGNQCIPESSDLSPKKVSFGLDLKYWGEKTERAQVPMNNSDCHRFWRPSEDGEEKLERGDVYGERVFTYIGEMRRAEKACRARLKNGKLCPRMDIERCPIHGLIVDRDEEGFPLEELPSNEQSKRAEREEEEYMRDLEAGLGMSFQGKKKRKSKTKEDKRSTVDDEGKAVRNRLETKLLNPRTIKRVSAVLDEVRRAKIQKKFGDQTSHQYL